MKKIILGLVFLSSFSAFAEQVCRTVVKNDDPFAMAFGQSPWLDALEYQDGAYTYCAQKIASGDSVILSEVTVNYGYKIEASKKNARRLCEILVHSKVQSFETSPSDIGVGFFNTVTVSYHSPRNAAYMVGTQVQNAAFESIKCNLP